jgi:hypothetical protein
MMLEPDRMDWSTVDDTTVFYAANDGIPEAIAEQQRREREQRTSQNSQE